MKLSRRTNAIILWVISIGLLVSMVIAFTPTLGGMFGRQSTGQGDSPEAFSINGQEVSELDVARARQNPPFNLNLDGEAGQDIDLLLVESLVDAAVLEQAAEGTRVSSGEVNSAVDEFRQQQGVAGSRNDQAYLRLISGAGYTDATFRDAYRDQLRAEKYEESLTEEVTVSDEEVQAFYEVNSDAYRSEERIRARTIVVGDEETATQVYDRAVAGDDFGELANEFSTERAERNGALGAGEGSTDPQPVGRAALPTQAAEAAFSLQGSGLTDIVPVGEQFYLTSVEEYLPASPRPLEEVQDEVEADALASKQEAVIEQRLTELRQNAEIAFPEGSELNVENPVVATVGEQEIRADELNRAVYFSPQIQQSLNAETASLITGLFKPSTLDQLINRDLAYQGAQQLDATFIGTEGQVAQSALTYVSRDATASEEELQEYYDDNTQQFTVPARALVTRINFDAQDAATAFRSAVLEGTELQAAAEEQGGTVVDLGTVGPATLQPELDTALFGTDAFTELPESSEEVSDVLVLSEPVEAETGGTETGGLETGGTETSGVEAEVETDAETGGVDLEAAETGGDETDGDETDGVTAETETGGAEFSTETGGAETGGETGGAEVETREVYVVLVAERTPERVRPFEEVQVQVEETVLQGKRAELQETWLEGLREDIPVENLLAQAEPDFETTPLPGETGGVGTGGVETGGLETGGLETGGLETGGAENSAETGAAETGGVETGAAASETEPVQADETGGAADGAETDSAETGGAETDGAASETESAQDAETGGTDGDAPASDTDAETTSADDAEETGGVATMGVESADDVESGGANVETGGAGN